MGFDWQDIFHDSKDTLYFAACSGGVDSMVLCYLMHKAGLSFEILHVNYQLRGESSLKDEDLVVSYAASLNKKVHVQRYDTEKLLKNGGNLQQLCRELRYNWFRMFTEQHPGSKIVLAHHLDDQVETFYLHLARNAGIAGLSSLKAVNGNLLRPLLQFTKKELYAFARTHNIPWREDASNSKNDYARNKLRNVFLPFAEQEIPDLRSSVLNLIAVFQNNYKELETALKTEVGFSKHFELNILQFSQWPADKKNVFLHLLEIRNTALDELEKLKSSDIGKFIEIDNWFISKEKEVFAFDQGENLSLPELLIKPVTALPGHFSKEEIYLDKSKIKGELYLRKWKEGDRLEAIGVKGSKLVSKIINEARLSAYEKRRVFVLADEENIHWIVGIKIGRKAVATASSTEIVKVYCLRHSDQDNKIAVE